MSNPDRRYHLLGLREIADLLGTRTENVQAWIDAGILPVLRVGARGEMRASLAMVEAWQAALGSGQFPAERDRSGTARSKRRGSTGRRP